MRDDPLPEDTLSKLLEAAGRVRWSHGFPDPAVKDDYTLLVEVFWYTGAHPSVLTRTPLQMDSIGPRVRIGDETDSIQWKRPKTKTFCEMPIPKHLTPRLQRYLARPKRYSTRQMQRILLQVGEEAGIEGPLTPRRLRHTVGYWLTVKAGPGVAKDNLGVSDKVLQYYTRRMGQNRLKEVARNWIQSLPRESRSTEEGLE